MLDLRTKISSYSSNPEHTFKYHCDNNDLSRIKIVLINLQLTKRTIRHFGKFILSCPMLEFLDLGATIVNGYGGKEFIAILEKLLKNRPNLIIDGRGGGLNMGKDITNENLWLGGGRYIPPKCHLCNNKDPANETCEICCRLREVGSKVWDIVYHYHYKEKLSLKDMQSKIDLVKLELNQIIEDIPDNFIESMYHYLRNDKKHPSYPGEDKVTFNSTKKALQHLLKQYKLELNEGYPKATGIIFNLFDMGDHGDVPEYWYGWTSLFEYDAWTNMLSYLESDIMYKSM